MVSQKLASKPSTAPIGLLHVEGVLWIVLGYVCRTIGLPTDFCDFEGVVNTCVEFLL